MGTVAERYLRTLESNALDQPANNPASPSKLGSPKTPANAADKSPRRSPLRASPSKDGLNFNGLYSRRGSPARTSPARDTPGSPMSPRRKAVQPIASDFSEELPGLGRKRLQHREGESSRLTEATSWDRERKNLQAYEYLCHVGEAKEWLESIIGEELPDPVDLPNSLVDGVALAKVTRHFRPDLVRHIFEHPRLQYKHTVNINCFFDFLKAVGIPDLFNFELIDLYERKNIPRVIYCIHALSHILADENLAPTMGDLIGKLDFTDDQLNKTQRGLDAAGNSMPNFNAVSKHFGKAGPAPKAPEPMPARVPLIQPDVSFDTTQFPVDQTLPDFSEEEMMLIQLENAESEIIQVQAFCRGYTTRSAITDLTSSLHAQAGLFAGLESCARGALLRNRMKHKSSRLALNVDECRLKTLQSVIRGNACRNKVRHSKSRLDTHAPDIPKLQGICRGHLLRKSISSLSQPSDPQLQLSQLQAIVRGNMVRAAIHDLEIRLDSYKGLVSRLQQASRAFLARKKISNKALAMTSHQHDFVTFQAIARGYLARMRADSPKRGLENATKSIVGVQSAFRGLLLRFELGCLYDDLDQEIVGIVGMQAKARGYLERKSFAEVKESWSANIPRIVKIQSLWRAKRQGDAYKSLIADSNPSLATVKRFAHLLNDTEADYNEELVLEDTRRKLSDQVRSNEQLEHYIDQLDTKIALLLKNKISLDEVIQHRNAQNHILRRNSSIGNNSQRASSTPSSKDSQVADTAFDLKALNKSSRRRLELYQGLFYVLQTQPIYLAKPLAGYATHSTSDKEIQRITDLILASFGEVQTKRDEFFFLQFLCCCFELELDRPDGLAHFGQSSLASWRLYRSLNMKKPSRDALKQIFRDPIRHIHEKPGLNLESNPLVIYRSIMANENAQGSHSDKDPHATIEQAIQDPTTRTNFVQNLQQLRELSVIVLDSIGANIDKLPYHVRFLASEVYNQGLKKFSMCSEGANKKSLQLAGRLIFSHFILPALLSAETLNISEEPLDIYQAKSLSSVAKVVGQAAEFAPFGIADAYLQPLNEFVGGCSERIQTLTKNIINVPNLQCHYGMTTLDDVKSCRRPVLLIKTADILGMHSMIFHDLDAICPSNDDVLRPVIKQLGPVPNDAREILDIAKFSKVRLDLNPSFGTSTLKTNAADSSGLFSATKRCLVYVLRVQKGSDLMEVLLAPVEREDEYEYARILALGNEQGSELANLTFRELKLLTLEKVLELESLGVISRESGYQEILNSLAGDIRNKHNRRQTRANDLVTCNETIASLEEKEKYLKNLQTTYNNYIEQAMTTLQSQSQAKKKLVLPFSRKFFNQREIMRSGRVGKFGTYRYTAERALEKGILVNINGYSQRQYKDVNLTFSCDEIGKFSIEAAYKGILLPGASTVLTLDDLLGRQYDGQPHIDLFDDSIRFHTERLLQFIFRKFYGATD